MLDADAQAVGLKYPRPVTQRSVVMMQPRFLLLRLLGDACSRDGNDCDFGS